MTPTDYLTRLRAMRSMTSRETGHTHGDKSDRSPSGTSVSPVPARFRAHGPPSVISGSGGVPHSGQEVRDSAAAFPAWLGERYRRAALEAGSITWLDQVLLWPADVYAAWEERATSLEHDDGLSREGARARAYLEYCQHNVTTFPTEGPSGERRSA
jgi:hypothetical protein